MDFKKPEPPYGAQDINAIICEDFRCGTIKCKDCILQFDNWEVADKADKDEMIVAWLQWLKSVNLTGDKED